MNTVIRAFLCCFFLTGIALGMEVKPANFSGYSGAGTFSFDFVVSGQPASDAAAVQVTIASITGGTSALVLNSATSEAVKTDAAYWLAGNQPDPFATKSGSSYLFSDSASSPPSTSMDIGDKIARFSFAWDGTPGTYTFNMNLNSNNSFVDLSDFSRLSFALPTGTWYAGPITSATSSSFTVNLVPEPVSIVLLGLGGLMALKRRAR
jgi:hypothetical protein